MFIRIKYSNHDITGSKRSIQIVENIRHGNKVKQKIVPIFRTTFNICVFLINYKIFF